jgi:Uma2 family endonuclease
LDRVAELRFTLADYMALPEGMRVELIEGELLKMANPTVRHQRIVMRLAFALARLLGMERVLLGPVGVNIDDFNGFQPDLVVVPADALPDDAAREVGKPQVVVEVLSPSTKSRDRKIKAKHYFGKGVAEVWLVDGDARSVEVRTASGSTTMTETLKSAALPEIDLPLREIFGG